MAAGKTRRNATSTPAAASQEGTRGPGRISAGRAAVCSSQLTQQTQPRQAGNGPASRAEKGIKSAKVCTLANGPLANGLAPFQKPGQREGSMGGVTQGITVA